VLRSMTLYRQNVSRETSPATCRRYTIGCGSRRIAPRDHVRAPFAQATSADGNWQPG